MGKPMGSPARPPLRSWTVSCALFGFLAALGCGSSSTSPAGASLSISCAATPTSGPAPLGVAFTSTVVGPNPPYGVVVTYGDGTANPSGNAGHVYTQPGSYAVLFTASGSGETASCSQSIQVSPGGVTGSERPPDAEFGVTPRPPAGPSPLLVTFNMCKSFDPDGDRLQYSFQFGDGASASGACRASHTYVGHNQTFGATVCVSDGHTSACHTYFVQLN